jgi:hypothetical protein
MVRAAACSAALVAALSGCVIFTGSTDGYSATEAGVSASCHSPKDCNGQACCFELGDGGVPSAVCQATCTPYLQSCALASDCGDGGVCWAQSCTYEGITVQVTTCGPIPICTQ